MMVHCNTLLHSYMCILALVYERLIVELVIALHYKANAAIPATTAVPTPAQKTLPPPSTNGAAAPGNSGVDVLLGLVAFVGLGGGNVCVGVPVKFCTLI